MKPVIVIGLAAVALVAAGIVAAESMEGIIVKKPYDKTDKGRGGGGGGTPQITWHGGSVLKGAPVPVYVIYYGTGFPASTRPIVSAFLAGLGGTPQFNVNTTYCESQTTDCSSHKATSVSGSLSFADPANIFVDAGGSQSINSGGVIGILQYALSNSTAGHLPTEDGSLYIVITAPDIKVSGFCSSFCAYHTRSSSVVSGHVIHYALVPEPSLKCTACDGNFAMGEAGTPTGDAGADEMVDSIMHELSETVTDPDLNAWYTSSGAENGDLCNYQYGKPLGMSNGGSYNASWGTYNYLIQLIWKNGPIPQSCAAAP